MVPEADVSPTQEQRLQEVLAAYLRDLEAGRHPNRDEILAEHPDLAGELQDFFAAHQQLGRLAEPLRQAVQPNTDPQQTTDPTSEIAGTTIAGRYKLLEPIGHGGMGQVWMADQRIPVKRLVALKLIKAGMDSRAVLTRFEAERQALALMDHANIARVFDGGTTDAGRPYFVMELVKGLPLTTYCDERRLSVPERLELFVQVCSAVQHAHQKGIMHRDLKPSNILVTEYDGRPVPKVIDFGLAKALTTNSMLTEHTLHTAFGTMVGTPLYMAPEQVGINALDVDTRTDVYSLGVLLYEVLTGTTPFDKETLKKASYDEMRRIIREDEPPRPSTRLSTIEQAELSTISERRGQEPRRLSQQMRGELDWIVMKALEKERSRRYESASAFAADLQRYLDDEPVQACPPSKLYRLRKFARRHKAGLRIVWSAAVCTLLIVAVVGACLGWVVRDRAARRAETERVVTVGLKNVQQLQDQARWPEALAAAQQVEELLAGRSIPEDLDERLRDWLKDLKMVARLEEARLQTAAVISPKAWDLGMGGAEGAYERAFREYGLPISSRHEPAEVANRIQARPICLQLAAALDDWSRMRRARRGEADTRWKLLLAIAQAADPDPWRGYVRAAWERKDRDALLKAAASVQAGELPAPSLDLLGWRLWDVGVVKEAMALLREGQRRHPADFGTNFDLGFCLYLEAQPSRSDEAIRFLTAALALRPRSPAIYLILGIALGNNGMYEEAAAVAREAIRLKPDLALTHNNLAWLLATCPHLKLRDPGQAVAHAKKAVELAPSDGVIWNTLGVAQYRNGKWKAAIEALMKFVQLRKGGDSFDFFFLAMAHWQLNEKEKAREWYDQAVAWMDKNRPQDGELKRFRAEAAALLGLTKTADTQKPDTK